MNLKKYFELPEFYDPNEKNNILAPMPDKRKFLKKRNKKQKVATFGDFPEYLFAEPALSREQEYHLFRRFNFNKFRYNNDKNHSLKKRILKDRNQLISSNTRLITIILKKKPEIDVFDVSILALIRAVDNFDYRRGFKFSTYATTSIINNANRIPFKKKQVSLDESQSVTYGNFNLVDTNIDIRTALRRAVNRKERNVVKYYYGIDEKPVLFQEISEILCLPPTTVHRLHESALNKLYLFFRSKNASSRL